MSVRNNKNKQKTYDKLFGELATDIKEIYNSTDTNLTDREANEAVTNLIRFYKKMVDIEIRLLAEEDQHLEPG